MITQSSHERLSPPRILMFSQRNIYEREVWRCAFHEFEGILQQIDSVELLAPRPKRWYKNGKRVALGLGKHLRVPFNPGIQEIKLNREYDVFLAVCEKASELLNLTAVDGWRTRCRASVCWLTEFYVHEMALHKSCLEVLSQFDHVLFMFSTNEPFRKFVTGQGRYVAAGIDALRFCPYPRSPRRSIDVLSIGRRSEVTHQALLRLAQDQGIFYVHDTIDSLDAYDLDQHRRLVADMAQRSRYFMVNPGKIDVPAETGGQSEFGYRYFEGAAAGAILVGERAKNKEFDRIFSWEDAVIHLPFGSCEIGAVIQDLDGQPQRLQAIRRNNMIQSLLHHDWAYRWESVLDATGLQPMPGLLARKARLADIAAQVAEAGIEA